MWPAEGRSSNVSSRSAATSLPKYIPRRSFALALLDLVARDEVPGRHSDTAEPPILSLDSIRRGLDSIDNPEVKRLLLIAIDSADGQLDKVCQNLQEWFDTAMDGIASRYRRATKWDIFWIALLVTVTINVDTFRLADYFYRNGSVREAIVARATEVAKQSDPGSFQAARAELDLLQLPIGWLNGQGPVFDPDTAGQRLTWVNFKQLLTFIPGWLVTTFSVTLGSLFWFDLLKMFMAIRTSIRPGEKGSQSKE